MKKTYINPTVDVVKMETRTIIASSVGISSEAVSAASAEGHGNDGDDW